MTPAFQALAFCSACALAPLAAQAATTVSVTAGYDYAAPSYVANTFFTVANATGTTLSNIVFKSVGDGSASSADTATWTGWSGLTIAAGSSLTLYFPAAGSVSGAGYGFTADYEFTLAGNDQTYTFSAVAAGQMVSASFSPASNASGSFVAFLGNDMAGNSLPASVAATVATIAVSTVPEPLPATLMAAGLSALGLLLAARRGAARPRPPALLR